MPQISAVIITYNEERNIERCILSAKTVADEIIVVDSFSTDCTEEICKKYNVRFIAHHFEGYVQQKNWALSQASHDCVLSLDADEALSDELRNAILAIKDNWKYDGYNFNRRTYFLSRWIRFGCWYPDKKLRLFNRKKGSWGSLNPHDVFIPYQGSKTIKIKGDLLHFPYLSINEHIDQINNFSTIIAREYYKIGKKTNWVLIILHTCWRFFRDYFIKLGFLDGYIGFVVSVNYSYNTYLKYVKLKHLWIEARNQAFKINTETTKQTNLGV